MLSFLMLGFLNHAYRGIFPHFHFWFFFPTHPSFDHLFPLQKQWPICSLKSLCAIFELPTFHLWFQIGFQNGTFCSKFFRLPFADGFTIVIFFCNFSILIVHFCPKNGPNLAPIFVHKLFTEGRSSWVLKCLPRHEVLVPRVPRHFDPRLAIIVGGFSGAMFFCG